MSNNLFVNNDSKYLTEKQVIESLKTTTLTKNDLLLVKLPRGTDSNTAKAIREAFKKIYENDVEKPKFFFYIGDIEFSKISLETIENQNKEPQDEVVD